VKRFGFNLLLVAYWENNDTIGFGAI
jgi:hypothetical protein